MERRRVLLFERGINLSKIKKEKRIFDDISLLYLLYSYPCQWL